MYTKAVSTIHESSRLTKSREHYSKRIETSVQYNLHHAFSSNGIYSQNTEPFTHLTISVSVYRRCFLRASDPASPPPPYH